jgi:cytochrome b subunit of formate dehydrogenase
MIAKDKLGLQDYFYIGYLYLIILGIVSDAIFYGIFGVSYLNYTTILDALMSPISLLINNWILSLALFLMFGLFYLYITKWMPKIHKKYRDKKWYRKINNVEKVDKNLVKLKNKNNLIINLMFLFFLLFVSMRTGLGLGLKHKYSDKEIIPNYTLVFKDNTKLDVRKVGQNSAYFFYFISN